MSASRMLWSKVQNRLSLGWPDARRFLRQRGRQDCISRCCFNPECAFLRAAWGGLQRGRGVQRNRKQIQQQMLSKPQWSNKQTKAPQNQRPVGYIRERCLATGYILANCTQVLGSTRKVEPKMLDGGLSRRMCRMDKDAAATIVLVSAPMSCLSASEAWRCTIPSLGPGEDKQLQALPRVLR